MAKYLGVPVLLLTVGIGEVVYLYIGFLMFKKYVLTYICILEKKQGRFWLLLWIILRRIEAYIVYLIIPFSPHIVKFYHLDYIIYIYIFRRWQVQSVLLYIAEMKRNSR